MADNEKELAFQEEVLRQYDPEGKFDALFDRVESDDATPNEAEEFTQRFENVRDTLATDLGARDPRQFGHDDAVLVMLMIDANYEKAASLDEPLAKIIPLDVMRDGLDADYSKGWSDKKGAVNKPIGFSGSVAMKRDSEGLSPEQAGQRFGLKYPGSPYYEFGTQPGPNNTQVEDRSRVEATAPIMARVEIPMTPEIRAQLKAPIDPRVLEAIVKVSETNPKLEKDPEKRALLERHVAAAKSFLERHHDKLIIATRGDPRDVDENAADADRAIQALDKKWAKMGWGTVAKGNPQGMDPPYTGNTAPGEWDTTQYTCVGTEFYIPRENAIPIGEGARIELITTADGKNPCDKNPAGAPPTLAAVYEDGKWKRVQTEDEYKRYYEKALRRAERRYPRAAAKRSKTDSKFSTWKRQLADVGTSLGKKERAAPPPELRDHLKKSHPRVTDKLPPTTPKPGDKGRKPRKRALRRSGRQVRRRTC